MKTENFFFELLKNNIPQADSDESEERSMSNGEFIAAILIVSVIVCGAVAVFRLW
ncbi:MAG: hypothetical protein WAV76_05065 [Bacteroidota bacterium]